jgi:hypothetical protein
MWVNGRSQRKSRMMRSIVLKCEAETSLGKDAEASCTACWYLDIITAPSCNKEAIRSAPAFSEAAADNQAYREELPWDRPALYAKSFPHRGDRSPCRGAH